MSTYRNHGITQNTPKRISLNAGTIHFGLKYSTTDKSWNFEESLVCATQGGNKFTYAETMEQIEVDNAFVPIEGLDIKYGDNATLEANAIEITDDIIQKALHLAEDSNAGIEGYKVFKNQSTLPKGTYVENVGFVSETTGGKPIIIIMDLGIITSGLELDTKSKQSNPYKLTIESRAPLSQQDYRHCPIRIYYPEIQEAEEVTEVAETETTEPQEAEN